MFADRNVMDEASAALLEPVLPTLESALQHLPSSPPLQIKVKDVPGFCRLDGRTLWLSHHLLGPDLAHPHEPTKSMPPLDRWRRAAGCVLESIALLGLTRRLRRSPKRDWKWVGASIFLADRSARALELAQPDLAEAIRTGDPGRHPRCGVAPFLFWEHKGVKVQDKIAYLLTGGVISAQEWSEVGDWVLSVQGGGASLPVVVNRVDATDIPCAVTPWSWRPIDVPSHPRGGLVHIEGEGCVLEPWAIAGQRLKTVVGAVEEGCRLSPTSGGPVGRWELASASGFGQVFGARGVQFEFGDDGTLAIVLADAFVGPLAALAMADEMGTSGVARGNWSIGGRFLLRFSNIAKQGLTMHGRHGQGFMVPAQGFGLGEWLDALEDAPWAWQENGGRLVMRGRMLDGAVEVRMKRAGT